MNQKGKRNDGLQLYSAVYLSILKTQEKLIMHVYLFDIPSQITLSSITSNISNINTHLHKSLHLLLDMIRLFIYPLPHNVIGKDLVPY